MGFDAGFELASGSRGFCTRMRVDPLQAVSWHVCILYYKSPDNNYRFSAL